MTPAALDPQARALLAQLPALVGDGVAVLVTVLQARGSAPRGPGARMVVQGGRLVAGTIGGGNLEARALSASVDVEMGDGSAVVLPIALGPELAQCCGGAVTLGLVRIDAAEARRLAKLARDPAADIRAVAGDFELIERVGAMPTVVVFGAGHVAKALAQVLAVMPWRVVVCDGRAEFADAVHFPAGVEVVAAEPAALLRAWGWPRGGGASASENPALSAYAPPSLAATSVLVMTHDHALDRELVAVLLATRDAAGAALDYVGLIGSRTKIASTRRRLRGRVSDDDFARLVAPIGLRLPRAGAGRGASDAGDAGDAGAAGELLGGKLPGEIAVSVVAQLIARRQGHP